MDSAELQRRLTQQEKLMEEMCHLLRQPIPTPPMSGIITHIPPLFITMPGKYEGSPGKCNGFLIYIENNPTNFTTDKSRVDFNVSLLTGKALDWTNAIWTANSTEPRIRGHSPSGSPIGDLLIELQQGCNSAAEYALELHTMTHH